MDQLLLSRAAAAVCLAVLEGTQARLPHPLLLHLVSNNNRLLPVVASLVMLLSWPHQAEVGSLELATQQHHPVRSEQRPQPPRPQPQPLRRPPRAGCRAVSSATRLRPAQHPRLVDCSATHRAQTPQAVRCLELPQAAKHLKLRQRSHLCLGVLDLQHPLVLPRLRHNKPRNLRRRHPHPSVKHKHKHKLRSKTSSVVRQQHSHHQEECLATPARPLQPLLPRRVDPQYLRPLPRTTTPAPAVCSGRSLTPHLPRRLAAFSAALQRRHHSRLLLRRLLPRVCSEPNPLDRRPLLPRQLLPAQRRRALSQQLPRAISQLQAASLEAPQPRPPQRRLLQPQQHRHPRVAVFSVLNRQPLPLLLHLRQLVEAYLVALLLPRPLHQLPPPRQHPAHQPQPLPQQAVSSAANPPTTRRQAHPPLRLERPHPPPTSPPLPWDPPRNFLG